MKKIITTVATSLVLTIGISTALTSKLNTVQNVPVATNSSLSENKIPEQSVDAVLKKNTITQDNLGTQVETPKNVEETKKDEIKSAESASTAKSSTSNNNAPISSTSSQQRKTTTIAKADIKPKQSLSRGGSPIPSQKNTYSNTTTKSSNTLNSNATSKYGELLSWNQTSSLIPRGSTVQVTDLSTGKTFNTKRTFGTNHIDGEALTVSDTNVIKNIWGGFSWARRPVIVSINGRKIAASMTAMPHAGVDSAPAVKTVSNRSDGYGTGGNLDTVKNNGMDGVIDIHFLNSTRHKDNRPDPQHQAAILKAAGK